MSKNKIIVFGGTGYYGQHIVRSLIRKGEAVKVLSRDKARAKKILGDEPEIIEGDITRRESVQKSLKGTKAIILSISAFHPKLIRKMQQIERDAVLMILKEAKSTGITRVVYLSVYEMRENLLRELRLQKFGAIKLEIEKTLSGSPLNWTILGCAPSMELFFTFLKKDKMMAPGGGAKAIPCISAQDVGEIAAQTIMRSDLKGMRFRLTGPETFSFPQAAQRMARVSGIPVKIVRIPLFVINTASIMTLPFHPFIRYVYWSLKLLNNFPQDLAEKVPMDHQLLLRTFDYIPTTFDEEIQKRLMRKQK